MVIGIQKVPDKKLSPGRSFLVLMVVSLLPSLALSQETAFLPNCNGYNSQTKSYKPLEISFNVEKDECPLGSGIIFHRLLFRNNPHPEQREIVATCCPLPEGALGRVLGYFPVGCPDNSIITGARLTNGDAARSMAVPPRYELQCTEINTQRFHLGPISSALSLDYGEPPPYENMRDPLVPWRITTGRHLIPRSLVKALGRTSEHSWLPAGCLGYPWGGFMTKMGLHNCKGMEFRQIFFNSPPPQSDAARDHQSSDSSTNR